MHAMSLLATGRRRLPAQLTPLVLALGVAGQARAEDVPAPPAVLPTVEVTSEAGQAASYITLDRKAPTGKLDVAVEDTPYAITVVDQAFIQDSGAKTIQDALLYSSGVYSGAFGLDTRGDWAKIRGLDASFYLDGLRQIYGYYNSVRTNVYALESVEVLKGPSSVLYGQGELGGLVNSVSKLPKAEQQGEIWAQAGSFDRRQLAADVTGPLTDDGQLLYRLVALKRDSDTQVDYVEDDGELLAPSITWLPRDGTRLTLLVNQQENTGQVSAQFLPIFGTLEPGPQGRVGSETFVGEPGWDRYDREKTEFTLFFDQLLSDNWVFSATARQTDSEAETREHWVNIGAVPTADGDVGRTIYTVDRATDVFNADARIEGSFDLGVTRHTLAVGVDYQDALWEEDNYYYGFNQGGTINLYNPQYGNLNAGVITPTDRNDNAITQTGFYIADHMEIGKLVVSSALRYDKARSTLLRVDGTYSASQNYETTGRVGVMYRFDNGLSPYVSYAEAFNMNLGGDGVGGTLDPTTGDQTEGGIKYLSADRSFALTAAYFDIEQKNRIAQGNNPGGVEQVGAVVTGWELEANKRWKQFETQLAYTDLNAINDQTRIRLSAVAERVISLWNQVYLGDQWKLGAGVRYVGDNVGGGGEPVVPSVTLYDAMVGYQYADWEFSVDAKNLGDEEYVSWCRGAGLDCGYGERRNVTANARYRF